MQGQTSAYIVTDLSNDDATQVPSKLNNLGDLVGRGARDGVLAQVQATIWNHSSSTKKHLGAFAGGDYSSATGINDYGEITGASNIGTGIVPFVWTVGGSLKRVPLLSGDKCGQTTSINNYSHVVGYSPGKNGAKAFFWALTGRPRQLAILPGGAYGKPAI